MRNDTNSFSNKGMITIYYMGQLTYIDNFPPKLFFFVACNPRTSQL